MYYLFFFVSVCKMKYAYLLFAVLLISCQGPKRSWEFIDYYPDGSPKILHGTSDNRAYLDSSFTRIEYYPSGFVMNRSVFKNGQLDDQLIGFFDSGRIGAVHGYLLGKFNGQVLDFYENGRIKSNYFYDRNVTLEGGEFFPNGQSMGDLKFTNGRLEYGTYFHRNGELRSEGAWRYGKKIGPWYSYDTLGVIMDSIIYPDPVGDRIRAAQKAKEASQK